MSLLEGFFLHHVPVWHFLKAIASLHYPQAPEMLFDGRQLHPAQVDKPWKGASDNTALGRCIRSAPFQHERDQHTRQVSPLLSGVVMAACRRLGPQAASKGTGPVWPHHHSRAGALQRLPGSRAPQELMLRFRRWQP